MGPGGEIVMIEITIGALTALLGVVVGCIVLELAMRALKYSLRSVSYEQTGEQARISRFVPGDHA